MIYVFSPGLSGLERLLFVVMLLNMKWFLLYQDSRWRGRLPPKKF